jgi:hypothetical protein
LLASLTVGKSKCPVKAGNSALAAQPQSIINLLLFPTSSAALSHCFPTSQCSCYVLPSLFDFLSCTIDHSPTLSSAPLLEPALALLYLPSDLLLPFVSCSLSPLVLSESTLLTTILVQFSSGYLGLADSLWHSSPWLIQPPCQEPRADQIVH